MSERRDGDRGGVGCRGEDLRDFLQQISSQIADADRRHGDTLRDLRDRLARLGDRTGELKEALPKGFEADIERLETGMAELSAQIATAAESRDEAGKPVVRTAGGAEPPALKSAVVAALGTAAVSETSNAGAPAAVAPAEAAAPAAQPVAASRDDEPWDANAAEALVKLYDSGEAGPARPRILQETGIEMQASLVAGAAAPAGGAIAAPAYDPARLDAKLDDIAARLDDSLAALRGDRGLAEHNARFEQFEQSWASTLSEVATRTDVEGLRIVEAHIVELSERVEKTQTHLARLDAIEMQLESLGGKLSDDNIVNLFGGLVPTEEDLARLAEQAAERAVAGAGSGTSHASAAMAIAPGEGTAHAVTEERLGALQQMLSGFIDERRQGAAETNEALITLREAMQLMLDRVEAMESKWSEAPAHGAMALAPLPMPTAPAAEPSRWSTPVKAAPRPTAAKPATVEPVTETFEEVRAAARAAKAAADRSGAGQMSQDAAATEVNRAVEPAFASADAASEVAPGARGAEPARAGGAPVDLRSIREAQRRGAAEAQRMAAEAAPAKAVAGKNAGLRDKLFSAGGGDKAGVRSGMLVVSSVLLLLLAGYWFLVAPKSRAVAPMAARIEQPAPANAGPGRGEGGGEAPAIDTDAPAQKPGQGSTPERDKAPTKGVQGDATPRAPRNGDVAEAPQGSVSSPTAGIAVQQAAGTLTQEEIAAARQKMHLAALSQRTAQHAAELSAARPVAIPASVRQSEGEPMARDNAATSPATGGERMVVEMPPAAVGPMSLRLAAAKGDPSAQFQVGLRFAEGKGVPQDFGQAAAWYQRAASQGLPAAQYRLGSLFERGLGVKADVARARVWYTRAAEQGNVKAMHNLAVLSAGRDPNAADYTVAARWFADAAERGLADSQYKLGVLNESGLGVAKNPVEALKWYTIAARSGDKEAARRRDMLRNKLDAQSQQAADESIAAWRAKPVEAAMNDPILVGNAWQRRTPQTAARDGN